MARAAQSRQEPVETVVNDVSDLKIDIDRVLDGLPPDLRTVLILRFFEDLPFSTISDLLGRPSGTVRRQVHEAIRQLRRLGWSGHGSTPKPHHRLPTSPPDERAPRGKTSIRDAAAPREEGDLP